MANPDVGDIFAEEFRDNDSFIIHHKDIKSSPLFGLGFGYDPGHYFRFDITGEYRGSAVFLAEDSYTTLGPSTNEYTADIESWSASPMPISISAPGIAFTPYIGGGVGFASTDVIGLKDVNVPNLGVAFAKDNTETNFAWALYAGLPTSRQASLSTSLIATPISAMHRAESARTTLEKPLADSRSKTSRHATLGVRWAHSLRHAGCL